MEAHQRPETQEHAPGGGQRLAEVLEGGASHLTGCSPNGRPASIAGTASKTRASAANSRIRRATEAHVKSRSTVSRAAAPRLARSAGSEARRASAPAMHTGSSPILSAGQSKPFTPSRITRATDPTPVATTGSPAAMYSNSFSGEK